MAEYTLVLEIGQLNAVPVGDIQGWEELHPYVALRSPQTSTSQIPRHNQIFTMPGTFKGGPQEGYGGGHTDGVISNQWQQVDCRGVAIESLRCAVFYSPIASYATPVSAAGENNIRYATNYPNIWQVDGVDSTDDGNSENPSPTKFTSNFYGQSKVYAGWPNAVLADSDVTIVHDATNGSAIDPQTGAAAHNLVVGDIVHLTPKTWGGISVVGEDLFKVKTVVDASTIRLEYFPSGVVFAPTAGDILEVQIKKAASHTITRERTGSTHTAATPFGEPHAQLVDPPFDPPPEAGEQFSVALQVTDTPTHATRLTFNTRFGGYSSYSLQQMGLISIRACAEGKLMVTSPVKPLRINRSFQTITSVGTETFVVTGSSTDFVKATATNFVVGDRITPVGSTWGLTAGTGYYVVYVSTGAPWTIRVSATPGGSAITGTAGSGTMEAYLPPVLRSVTPLWPVRAPNPTFEITLNGTFVNKDAGLLTMVNDQDVVEKEPLLITGSDLPDGLTSGNTYYAALTKLGDNATPVPGTIKLRTEVDGDPIDEFGDVGSGTMLVERLDAYKSFYFSTTRSGEEVAAAIDEHGAVADDVFSNVFNQVSEGMFRGALNGLQIRCTAGTAANVGLIRNLLHVHYDSVTTKSVVHHDTAWAATAAVDDTFVIEPTPVGTSERSFNQFCQLLPWSPFEGQAKGRPLAGAPAVTITSGTVTSSITVTVRTKADVNANPELDTYYGAPVRFYSTGTLPNGLVVGKRYYVVTATGTTSTISATYGGTAMAQSDAVGHAGSGTHYMEIDEQPDRGNPFPPGFNYPGHYSIPENYQAFEGPSIASLDQISSGVQLALDIQQAQGKIVLYANCAFKEASLGAKGVAPITVTAPAIGWSDPKQQLSWVSGEGDQCYQRFLDVLDGINLALTEESSTISDVVIYFVQGEEDANYSHLAANYDRNLRNLKSMMRDAIKERSFTSDLAARIKFIQPKIKQTNAVYPYASTVNAAIATVAEEDAYARWIAGDDIKTLNDVYPTVSDTKSYSGTGMNTLAGRAFTAWSSMQRTGYTDVQICNMALANIGDKGTITSVVPSDGSRQSTLCNQFYDLALNSTLQRHPWDFAIRRTSPTSVTVDRTEWQYSYYLPRDFIGVLSVLPDDPTDDTSYMGNRTSIEYSIDMDADSVRRLYCNQTDIVLRYYAKVIDTTQYTELFVQALAWKLSGLLVGPLVKGEAGVAIAQQAQKMFEFMLAQAAGFDASKTRERRLEDTTLSEWDRARGSSAELSEWDRYR